MLADDDEDERLELTVEDDDGVAVRQVIDDFFDAVESLGGEQS